MFLFFQHRLPTRAHVITQHTLHIVGRFLHIEAMSGVVLLFSAAVAVVWANSSFYESYGALWHSPVSIAFGSYTIAWDLHFLVNDIFMTLFFLVAGMEIRREIYDGALSDFKQASLPVIAALGGVCFPALIYLLLNDVPNRSHGWAIPTATDIAFAVGILALLGKSIPDNVRIMLLSLAIIDDVLAVLIIALFYSNGLDPTGLFIAACSIILVLVMQWLGLGSAWLYVVPAVLLWFGLLKTGTHPALAGVILGLLTPVLPVKSEDVDRIAKAVKIISQQPDNGQLDTKTVTRALRDIRTGERDMVPPVTRVQMALHPWVAFAVMPLFAFANAGIRVADVTFSSNGSAFVLSGIGLGLVIGKPLGILLTSFIAVESRICRLPAQVSWQGMILVGILAGVGFTVATFVSMLAFNDMEYLSVAKIGVLFGSTISAVLGVIFGLFYLWNMKRVGK
ncbi:MAG: NhaA family [Candidatus Tokpelaia sp. JSC085]|nr:MAG: NhaA family [Candidatus Tokpelaia sp. JSC085]